jgi:hypothetical protein
MIDMKNDRVWAKACAKALHLGFIHGSLGNKRPWTARELWETILVHVSVGGIGSVIACNGHVRLLRSIYGGAFNGCKLSRRAFARQQASESNSVAVPPQVEALKAVPPAPVKSL